MAVNGKVPDWELVPVSGVRLERTTATAFANMARDCKAAIVADLDIVNGGGGYRDLDYQRAIYRDRAEYLPIRIAKPGLSKHGLGTALDLTTTCFTPAVKAWLRANCTAYGFIVPPANDPRHFDHTGSRTGPTIPATPKPPRPIQEDEDDMYQYRSSVNPNNNKTEWVLLNPIALPDGHLRALNAVDATGWAQIAGNSELINWEQFAGAIDRAKAAHAAYMVVEAKKAALNPRGNNTAPLDVATLAAVTAAETIRQMKLPGN